MKFPTLDKDKWNQTDAVLRLDDLPDRDESLPVRLSIMMSINDYRRNQLARTLETLCRQDWLEFEVLVCDNGSRQDLESIFAMFRPLMRLIGIRLERKGPSLCPTVGLKACMEYASGEVWAIMQPEVMLQPRAAQFLYDAHFHDWPGAVEYQIALEPYSNVSRPKWAAIKPAFFIDAMMDHVDDVDWHSDIRNLEKMARFNTNSEGFSRMTRADIETRRAYPWWFVGSTLAIDPIWSDLPEFYGYSTVDQWLLNYRREHKYVDVVPRKIMGYHQWHLRSTGQPKHEKETQTNIPEADKSVLVDLDIDELRRWLADFDVSVPPGADFDTLWHVYLAARTAEASIIGTGADRRESFFAGIPEGIGG